MSFSDAYLASTHASQVLSAEDSNTIILSPEGHAAVKIAILEVEKKVDTLDEEIARLQAIRQSHYVRLERLQTAISPQKRLPLDVLRLIFEFSQWSQSPEYKGFHFPDHLRSDLSPWNVRHVCSSWRQAALDCLHLWNTIILEWKEFEQINDIPRKLVGLRWLRRLKNASRLLPTTGNVHISVIINSVQPQAEQLLDNAFNILVAPFFGRLASLTYDLPQSYTPCLNYLHRTQVKQMSLLDTLSLNLRQTTPKTDAFTQYSGTEYAQTFEGLSQLRNLQLVGDCAAVQFYLRLRLPWFRLSRLELSHIHSKDQSMQLQWKAVASVLRKCVSLQSLTLDFLPGLEQRQLDSEVYDPIFLPALDSLSMSSKDVVPLTHLITPSLRSLILGCVSLVVEDVIKFLEASDCQLELFEEKGTKYVPWRVSRKGFHRLLERLKSVKTFETITILNSDSLILIGNGQLLPALETFYFPTNVALGVLALLESRFDGSGPGGKIRKVVFDVYDPDMSPGYRDRLDDMIDAIKAENGTEITLQALIPSTGRGSCRVKVEE